MSKDKSRPTTGIDGQPLPVMPPERDGRVWGKMVRVAVYTPGFLAILLIKAGEPSGFGLTVAMLMLASASAIVAGLFIGTQSVGSGADHSSKTGVWCGVADPRTAGRGTDPLCGAALVPRAVAQ